MTNPYMAILKADNRSSILSSLLFVLIFGGFYYFLQRDSTYILGCLYFVSILYVVKFMSSVKDKHKMLLMFPATTKQLVHALYKFVIGTFTVVALAILPLYLLASTFDPVVSPLSETIILYIAIVGTILLYGVVSILLYFTMTNRHLSTLTEFVALIIISFISLSIVTTFERTELPVALQVIILIVLFSVAIMISYMLTIKHSQKSSIL